MTKKRTAKQREHAQEIKNQIWRRSFDAKKNELAKQSWWVVAAAPDARDVFIIAAKNRAAGNRHDGNSRDYRPRRDRRVAASERS